MAAQKGFSRRDFLKATGLSVVPLAVQHLPPFASRAFAQAVELSMWTWYQEQQDEFPILDAEFNESHTDTKITNTIYSNTTEYLPVLTSALAGGVAADIFGPHVYAIEYGLAGQTVDLNPLFGEDFMSQFFPATRRQFSAGDAQYALGWMAQTFGFFYNPALFEAAGLTSTPETWDELIEMCQQIKAAGIIPWTFNESDKWLGADFFLPLIAQATDDTNLVYDLDEHTKEGVSWNSEPVITALELVDKLAKAGIFQDGMVGTDWDTSTALFYGGGAAMMMAGSWVPQGILQNASPEFASSYRVFKMPAWAPGKTHWTGNQAGAALAVNAHGNVDAAVEYLKWLYEPDRYARTMNNTFSMPSTIAAAEMVTDPIMKEMTSWLPEGAPHILFGKGSWDAVSNAVQAVFAQTLTPAQAAEQMENDVIAARSR